MQNALIVKKEKSCKAVGYIDKYPEVFKEKPKLFFGSTSTTKRKRIIQYDASVLSFGTTNAL